MIQIFYRHTFAADYLYSYLKNWRANEFHAWGETDVSMTGEHVYFFKSDGSLIRLDFCCDDYKISPGKPYQ